MYLFGRTVRDGLLTPAQVVAAVAIGTVVGVAAVASLWLRMDIDWRFRSARAPRPDFPPDRRNR